MIEIKIDRWFQGNSTCGTEWRPSWFESPAIMPGQHDCLGSVVGWQNDRAQHALVDIIARLYPERACRCPGLHAHLKVIHFNNKYTTTRDMIDKVLHTYHLEREDATP